MKLVFRARVKTDVLEAAAWHTERSPDAADRFVDAVEAATRDIESFPLKNLEVFDGLRRVRVAGFPYRVCYAIKGDTKTVLAVLHAFRDPFVFEGLR